MENKKEHKASRSEWRKANADKLQIYHREWQRRNADKVKEYNRRYWMKKLKTEQNKNIERGGKDEIQD